MTRQLSHRLKPLQRSLVLLLFITLPAVASAIDAEDDNPADAAVDPVQIETKTIDDLPEEIQLAASAYQSCVNNIMSTLEAATVKRQQLTDQCQQLEQAFVATFPEVMQSLITTQTRGRLDNVLSALEEMEATVIETSVDVNEVAEELQALEQQQAQPESGDNNS
ncbi:hypothetical protein [Oceanicoccus sagamiensis]|uniref:Uncharacterized protein n=1 Tax=Oceanicoccus sagamiensis TaxID=716816 RepID=A0A1X9NF56_9GAMM|nr:hypothetical protein [Oceanicoccus sagamiensis]ARN72663.1 hypothetical protein BST96_00150 [Oceanicoccus sagamiensis]